MPDFEESLRTTLPFSLNPSPETLYVRLMIYCVALLGTPLGGRKNNFLNNFFFSGSDSA